MNGLNDDRNCNDCFETNVIGADKENKPGEDIKISWINISGQTNCGTFLKLLLGFEFCGVRLSREV